MSKMKRYRQHWRWKFALGSWLVMSSAIGEAVLQTFAFSVNCAFAQITPDRTLRNNSRVTTENNITMIRGGTPSGGNLFHSFQEFSVPTGSTASFQNAANIQNIISRVTGGSASNIDGLIRANGTANLFFLNPNGIVFGPNARLKIRGSFVASTASSVVFANGIFFSAKAPQTTPLLTVNVPIGLQFGENPGRIKVQEFGLKGEELRGGPGKTLALVGGEVQLDHAKLVVRQGNTRRGGRVELAGVGGPGTVRLTRNGTELQLSFPDSVPRTDVSLTNGAQLYVLDEGGSIAINARNLNLAGASGLQAGIYENSGSAKSQAGNIEVNATEKITLTGGSYFDNSVEYGATGRAGNVLITADEIAFDGESTDFTGAYSRLEDGANGQAGNIEIRARSLKLTNGAKITTSNRGVGNAGNVTISADTVSFDGQGNFRPNLGFRQSSGVFNAIAADGKGQGGSVNITARSLSLTNSGVIVTSTLGQGDAGNIFIKADTVLFDGEGTQSDFKFSGAYSNVLPGAIGNGGNVTVTTGTLSVINGAGLFARTDGQGDAGSVTINALDRVFFDGGSSDRKSFSGVFSNVEPEAVGKGGSIEITTAGSLSLTNGAALTSSSLGKGIAGNVQLTADFIELNQGAISSKTGAGNGGNITLSVKDILLLRQGSQISTTAGTALAGGDGGNITINAPKGFIVAVPNENSDITANAFTGSGGRVKIKASGIYGTQFREKENPQTSDITASSQFGIKGTVELNTPDIDPNSGLVNLPTVPVDTQVAQTCTAGSAVAKSSFTITGRGGLPPNPGEALNADAVQVDLVGSNPKVSNTPAVSTNPINQTPTPIVEATGWLIAANGDVILTSSAPTVTPHFSWQNPGDCRVFNQRQGG